MESAFDSQLDFSARSHHQALSHSTSAVAGHGRALGKKNTKETFRGANLHRLEWPIRMTLHFFFGLGISIKLHFPVLLGGGIPKYHLYDLYDTKKLHIYTYVCDSNCVLVDWTTALQVLSLADTSRCRNCAQFAHRCCLERRLLALDVGSAE